MPHVLTVLRPGLPGVVMSGVLCLGDRRTGYSPSVTAALVERLALVLARDGAPALAPRPLVLPPFPPLVLRPFPLFPGAGCSSEAWVGCVEALGVPSSSSLVSASRCRLFGSSSVFPGVTSPESSAGVG